MIEPAPASRLISLPHATAHIEHGEDQIVAWVEPDGLQRALDLGVIVAGVCALVLASGHWAATPQGRFEPLTGLFLVWGVGLLTFAATRARAWPRPEMLTVSRARILSEIRGLSRTRRYWPAASIAAVGAWDGLCVAHADGGVSRVMTYLPLAHQDWLAGRIRELLGAAERPAAPRGAIVVTFSGSFWPSPLPGFLEASVGRFTLCHAFADEPHLAFRPAGGLMPALTGEKAIPLEQTDVVCRVDAQEGSVLRIAPDGVRAVVMTRQPKVTAQTLWPLFQTDVRLRPGWVMGDLETNRREDFNLTICCDDPVALQVALGRFWGQADEVAG